MKKTKKLFALLLALALMVTAFTACYGGTGEDTASDSGSSSEAAADDSASGEDAQESDDTIHPMRIVQPGVLPTDYETGIAAVNEKLKEDGVNIEVSVTRIPWDAYAEKLNLMLTTGEEFELLHVM